VGPNFVKPEAAVSPSWLDADDWRIKQDPTDYRTRWKTFNDPVLDRLIDQAYHGNSLSGLPESGCWKPAPRSIGGRLYPRPSRLSVRFRKSKRVNDPHCGIVEFGPARRVDNIFDYWQDQIGVSASWEIDFWGKFRRAIESADANLLATVADYDSALVSLTADVTNAYIAIRTLEKRLGIARQNVETQKENLRIAEDRFRYGKASRLDAEQAKTLLNDTSASIYARNPAAAGQEQPLPPSGYPSNDLTEFLEGSSDVPVSRLRSWLASQRTPSQATRRSERRKLPGGRPERPDRRGQGGPLPCFLPDGDVWLSRQT
jgi:hypothetical protein